MDKYKIGFFCTSEFGNQIFDYLLERHKIEFVLTSCPKPKGRGMKIINLPFVEKARQRNLPVYFIEKKSQINESLREYTTHQKSIDFGVVVDFAFILPVRIMETALYYFINIHPSLLPLYRGASPIQYTLLNNETNTGVTLQKMSKEVDSGDILYTVKTNINRYENFALLYDKLRLLSTQCLEQFFYHFPHISVTPQNHTAATYTKKIEKEMALFSFSEDAEIIAGKINAFAKWPKVKVHYNGKQVLFLAASVLEEDFPGIPGEILKIDSIPMDYDDSKLVIKQSGLFIKCGKNTLIVTLMQNPGKKSLYTDEFMRGTQEIKPGLILKGYFDLDQTN